MINYSNITRFAFISLSCLFAVWLTGCQGKANEKQDQRVENTSTPVEVQIVKREDFTRVKHFSGAVEGVEQAEILPKLSERIEAVPVTVGTSVKKGQVLVVLEKGGPSSQYLQAQANATNSDKNLQRMKALYKEGAISLQTLDGVQTAADVAKANFESARQMVELESPINGVVTAVKARIGDMSLPGSSLVTVARLDEMKVIFNLNDEDMSLIQVGQAIEVYSESRADVVVKGTVKEYFKSADSQSRTFEVRGLFPNTADRWFKPGMYVKVKYSSSPEKQILVTPNQSILSDGLSNRVFIINNGRAFQKTIKVGATDGIRTVVLDGIAEHDSVVTVGWNNLHDSSRVAVMKTQN